MLRPPLAGVAAIAIGASAASAQLTLAIDVQGIDYQFRDGAGAPFFGGVTHTGTLEWTGATAITADTRVGSDGRFGSLAPMAQTVPMKDLAGELTFAGGLLTGGSFSVTLDNTEAHTYSASIKPGTGRLGASNHMGYSIDGLTINGAFSDAAWGDLDVTPWHDAQGGAGALTGAFFQFRFWPSPAGNGTADTEMFVLVPLPPAAWAGLAMLGGVGGLRRLRRRRIC